MVDYRPFDFMNLCLWENASPEKFASEYTQCLGYVEKYRYYPKQRVGMVLIRKTGQTYDEHQAKKPAKGTMVALENVTPRELLKKYESYEGFAIDFEYYPSEEDNERGLGLIILGSL